jgi:REJ domain
MMLYPVFVLTIPTLLGLCMNLTVDASASYGSCGREWTNVVWGVSVGNGTVTDVSVIERVLNTHQDISSQFTVDANLFDYATYTITLQLTNFLGQSSAVVTKPNNNTSSGSSVFIPVLSLVGSSFWTITRSVMFTIFATAILPDCASEESLTYKWTAYRNYIYQSSINSLSADLRRLLIAPFTLSSGQSYQFMVTVTASGGGSSQALVQVYVEKGKLDAVISGGSNRAVSRGLYVTLDASSSTDTDLDPSQDQNLQFT